MSNEFYCAHVADDRFYFKDRDKAFSFVWQKFLNASGDLDSEELEDIYVNFLYWYFIEGFGEVEVLGFED